jgi:hypothetical protein
MTRPIAVPVRSDNRASFVRPNIPLSLAWILSGVVLIAARFPGFEGVVIQSFASLHRQCVTLEKVNEKLNQSKNN